MMVVTIPAGWLSDKLGERIPIVIGFLIDAAAVYMFTFVEGFWGFATVWIIFGVGVGLQSPAYNSLVSKAFPEHMRGIAFGFFRSSLGVISLPVPYIGARLWDRFGPRFVFQLTALLAGAAAIPVWLKFKLPKAEETEVEAETAPSLED